MCINFAYSLSLFRIFGNLLFLDFNYMANIVLETPEVLHILRKCLYFLNKCNELFDFPLVLMAHFY